MYWLGPCSSQVARPCLRKPDIMIGTAMATAIETFNINRTATEIGTETEIVETETEIETGTETAVGAIAMMIATAETAMAILLGVAVTMAMDAVVIETPANTAIKMA
jgi:carbohydrate-binding DOMON domain-containing protein